jgi:hypothetical protein
MWGALSNKRVSGHSQDYMVLHVTIVYMYVQYIQGLHSRSCPNSCSSCCNGCLVTWTVVRLTAAKLRLLIFSVSGLAYSVATNIRIFMILYDLCSLSAQVRYVITNIRYLESHVQLAERRTTWKFVNGAWNLFCKRSNFKRWVSATNSQARQAQVITELINALRRVCLTLVPNRSLLNRKYL